VGEYENENEREREWDFENGKDGLRMCECKYAYVCRFEGEDGGEKDRVW